MTETYRVRNGNLIEESGFTDSAAACRFAADLATMYVGVTQAQEIIVETYAIDADGEFIDVKPYFIWSTGRMGTGRVSHLLWRYPTEQRWHARCRAVTRHATGAPHIQRTGGKADCKHCIF